MAHRYRLPDFIKPILVGREYFLRDVLFEGIEARLIRHPSGRVVLDDGEKNKIVLGKIAHGHQPGKSFEECRICFLEREERISLQGAIQQKPMFRDKLDIRVHGGHQGIVDEVTASAIALDALAGHGIVTFQEGFLKTV